MLAYSSILLTLSVSQEVVGAGIEYHGVWIL